MENDDKKIPWEPIEARLREMKRKAPWLADELGVDKNAVYNWPKRGGVPMAHLPKLMECLRLSADELLGTDTANSGNTGQLPPLSDEAELLIQCVLRLDGSDPKITQMFAHHASLLTLASQMMGMQDADVARELDIEEQRLTNHIDQMRTPHHAKRDHKTR